MVRLGQVNRGYFESQNKMKRLGQVERGYFESQDQV